MVVRDTKAHQGKEDEPKGDDSDESIGTDSNSGTMIVSVSQPFVRSVVRGKVGIPVEFGAKLNISVVNGKDTTQAGFCRIKSIEIVRILPTVKSTVSGSPVRRTGLA